MEKVIIFGITEMGKVAHYFFKRDAAYEVVAFTVNRKYNNVEKFCGLDIYDFEEIETLFPPKEYKLFLAIGPSKMNGLREQKFIEVKSKGYTMASYVSRHAVCDSPLGENCFVADMAVINPHVEVGDDNVILEGSILSSYCQIMNHCYISPGSIVGTHSKVLNNSVLGMASVIKTHVVVAEKTLVGASCYIAQNTEPLGVYGEKSSELYGCISDKVDISRMGN